MNLLYIIPVGLVAVGIAYASGVFSSQQQADTSFVDNAFQGEGGRRKSRKSKHGHKKTKRHH